MLQRFKIIFKMASGSRGNTEAEGGCSAVKLSDFNCCQDMSIRFWVSDFVFVLLIWLRLAVVCTWWVRGTCWWAITLNAPISPCTESRSVVSRLVFSSPSPAWTSHAIQCSALWQEWANRKFCEFVKHSSLDSKFWWSFIYRTEWHSYLEKTEQLLTAVSDLHKLHITGCIACQYLPAGTGFLCRKNWMHKTRAEARIRLTLAVTLALTRKFQQYECQQVGMKGLYVVM